MLLLHQYKKSMALGNMLKLRINTDLYSKTGEISSTDTKERYVNELYFLNKGIRLKKKKKKNTE